MFAVIALRLLLPVEGYGMAIMGVALAERNGPALLATPLVIGGLILAATYGMVRLTAQAQAAQEIKTRFRSKQRWITPGLFRFSTLFVFREQFAALAITKLLSFAALYYFSRPEEALYDPRMLWLIWISALMGHSVIIYRLFHFVETRLGFYRNLPIPVMRRFISFIPLYVLLLLPEAWALLGVGVNQHQWMDYGWMLCSGPAVLLLIHSLMLSAPSDMEETMKLLAGVWLVLIFFSLAQHWWIPLIGAVFAPVLFGMSYRQYEEKPEVINTE